MKSPLNGESTKYFLYARKSTEDEERQQLSIPAQIDELRSFAQKENLTLIDVLTESKTAKKPGRIVFNEMLSRIVKGEASGILSWNPDRLTRNAVDAGQIIHLLDTGKLLDLKFPTVLFQNNPQGLFMLSIAFGQSKYYVDSLSENTKRGLRQKVRKGEFPGIASVGYLNDRINKKIVIDKQTSFIVQEMFSLYAKGGHRLQDMSDFLAKRGILTSGGKHISKDRVKFLLTNPLYFGYFRYNGEIHQGIHEPLITKKLFDRVQEVIKERGFKRPKEPYNYPFAGFIRCGECGMIITAEKHIKRYKTINRIQIFNYYRCSKKNKTVKCKQPYIPQSKLLPQLNSIIQKVSLSTADYNWFIKHMNEDQKKEQSAVMAIVQGLKSDVRDLTLKLNKLLDSYLDNVIERSDYLQKKEELMSERKTLEEKISSLEQSPNKWLEPMRKFFDSALQADKIASDNTNLFEKRNFLIESGSNLILKDKKAHCSWTNQWAALCAAPK
ncbi:recombinase family protein, partial [Candidatus Roizmanbacteria bacterium]|nr:recombinase family protein [Candidatus Roizmanbacteria bacterium]